MQKFSARFVDVSKYQDDYDTPYKPTVKEIIEAGFIGIVVRVGYGLIIDRMFKWFWSLAKELGLIRFPYWYLDYYSNKSTGLSDEDWGAEQAEQCYEALKPDPGDSSVIVDCEEFSGAWRITYLNRGSYNRILKGFADRWKTLTGRDIWMYCSPGFMWVFDSWVKQLDLWMAWYNRTVTKEQVIKKARDNGWVGRILMWQYSSDGDVNDDGDPDGLELGFETDALDLNGWLGTMEELSAFCGNAIPPTPPPTEDPTTPDTDNFILTGYPLFSQRDERWRYDKLGTSVSTIGSYGCTMTGASAIVVYFGGDTDPQRLNKLLTEKGLYYNKNLFVFDCLDNLFNVKIDWTNFIDCATVPAPLDKIDAQLAKKFPVLVKVDFDTSDEDVDQHWVVIIGKENGQYIIHDPWDGQKVSFKSRYGDPARYIFRIVVWKGTPPAGDPLPPTDPPVTGKTKTVAIMTVSASSGLNIRSTPSTTPGSGNITGWIKNGQEVEILEVITSGQNKWARVGQVQYSAIRYNGTDFLV